MLRYCCTVFVSVFCLVEFVIYFICQLGPCFRRTLHDRRAPSHSKLFSLLLFTGCTVPPSISDAKKSDIIAQEGDTVTLWCMSSGTPIPQVTWYQCSHHTRHACSSATDAGLSTRLSVSSCL